MDCVNTVNILGTVCADPVEIKVSEDLRTVILKVITTKTYFSKKYDDYITASEKHSIKLWNKNALYSLENIRIDDVVFITGELHYYVIKNENDEDIKKTEIIASNIIKVK